MAMSTGGRHRLQSEINVTPLVDVCLVMLIIFMVVTPMIGTGVDVRLPAGSNPRHKPEGATQRTIAVTWESPPGTFLETRPLPAEALQNRLEEMYRRFPETDLVLKADRRLTYRDVKRILRMTREAGFQDVGLIAERGRPTP